MKGVLFSVSTLLVSVAILLVGHGLQLTLAPLYARELGWSTAYIGYLGSAYFLGFVLGCLTIPRLVARVGHIRVFSVLCASATAALLLLGFFSSQEFWLVARIVTGWSFAGLYMVIESWLNERSTPSVRATVLSTYTVVTLLGICLGQVLIGLRGEYVELILLGAILLAVGGIPVGLTRSPAPQPIPSVSFRLREVYSASNVAVIGAFVGGFVTSGFWSLGPIVAQVNGLQAKQIGIFMAVTMLGAALFQLPLGRFSDRFDRRIVIAGVAGVGAIVCLSGMLFASIEERMLYGVMFLFGGFTFPLYSLCVAHANDNTQLPLIEIASVVLLVHSAGAVIGPVVVASLMAFNPTGMFIQGLVMLIGLAVWTLWRVKTYSSAREHFQPYIQVPRTTHEVSEIATDNNET